MEQYIYAILNRETSICVGVSYLNGEVLKDDMMQIDAETAVNCIGKEYENDRWIEMPPEPEPISEPGNKELMAKLLEQEESALNRDELLLEQQLLLLNIDLNTSL